MPKEEVKQETETSAW